MGTSTWIDENGGGDRIHLPCHLPERCDCDTCLWQSWCCVDAHDHLVPKNSHRYFCSDCCIEAQDDCWHHPPTEHCDVPDEPCDSPGCCRYESHPAPPGGDCTFCSDATAECSENEPKTDL